MTAKAGNRAAARSLRIQADGSRLAQPGLDLNVPVRSSFNASPGEAMKCQSSGVVGALSVVVLSGWLSGCERQGSASRELDADALPMLTLVEELRIGSLDDPNYGFSSIDQVDVDDEGRVYVFDRSGFEIRVYAEDGALVRTIGRRGEGPGEFHRQSVRFGVLGDTVWAWSGDMDPGRITLFDRAGRVLSTAALEPVWVSTHTGCRLMAPMELGPHGLFTGDLGGGFVAPCASENPGSAVLDDSIGIPRVRFTSGGSVFDTAGVLRYDTRPGSPEIFSVRSSQYHVPEPPSSAPLHMALPDGRFVVVDRPLATRTAAPEFRVSQLDLAGDTIFTRAFQYSPLGYPGTVLDSIARQYSRMNTAVPSERGMLFLNADPADSADARAEIRRRLAYPDFQPPVQAGRIGKDGSIWLRREDTSGETMRWLILDPDGSPLGQVEVPGSRFRMAWVDRAMLWAIEPDDFGVPWLVRYRVDAPAPS